MGVDSWPGLAATQDTNEMTQPLTPFVRSLEAFNPSDKAIRIVNSGGVTTALVLPGSGNLMGGEAFAFKLRPVDTISGEDMLVQAGVDEDIDRKWRWMKMACGENPKVRKSSKLTKDTLHIALKPHLYSDSMADNVKCHKLVSNQFVYTSNWKLNNVLTAMYRNGLWILVP
jgi:hypothetical protein